MTIEQKMQLFEQIGRAVIEETKRLVDFEVKVINNSSGLTYRVWMGVGKKQRGYACPDRISAKDFENRFRTNLELIIK